MQIKLISESEITNLLKLWSVCFLSETNTTEEQRRIDRFSQSLEHAYGCYSDDGTLIAAILDNQYTMRFDGEIVKLGGVGGVATYPEYRGSGAVREIFRALLTRERQLGEVFSGLYPFSHTFYRKFGYELACETRVYKFAPALLKRYAHDARVIMLEKDDDRECLRAVYERFTHKYNLAITRDEKKLASLTASNPYEKNEYTYALYDNEHIVSYVCFTKQTSTLKVTDCAFAGAKGLHYILGFLYRMSAQLQTIEIELARDIPLYALIDEPYSVSSESKVSYMIRVLNCERVLEILGKRGEAPFTIQIDDEFLPENGGVWRVDADGARYTSAVPDIRMSVMAFSQLAVGFTDLNDALLRTDVELRSNEAALAQVFVKKPVFVGVYF